MRFPAFFSSLYYIKRGKILLKWYFIIHSVMGRTKEFISPITPLLPFLDIEYLNGLESNSKWGPCYSNSWNLFYFNVVGHLVKLACLWWKYFSLIYNYFPIETTCNLNISDCMSLHFTYKFQSGSTLYSCLNIKELLARNRRYI